MGTGDIAEDTYVEDDAILVKGAQGMRNCGGEIFVRNIRDGAQNIDQ